MKKHVLVLLYFLIIISFCACSGTKQIMEPTNKSNLEYLGFSNIPEHYTPVEAIKDGCFVIVSNESSDGAPEVYGENKWQSFYDNSNWDKDAFLRVAHFIDNEGYYLDLYYRDNQYYHYTQDEYGIRLSGPFSYLRALTGEDGIPKRKVTLYVLTDSKELTCEDVLWSFYSSNLETVTKIPFVWLGFTTYLENTPNHLPYP